MRKRFIYFMCVCLLVSIVCDQKAAASKIEVYKVGVGDLISINIIGHDDLSNILRIAPDGTVTFPYAGTIKIEGFTLEEIEGLVEEAVSPEYIQYPEVVVRLEEAKSQKFYVYGEVKNPGVYPLDSRMTILKAVAMSGGYGQFANTKKVKILRNMPGTFKYEEIFVNLDEIVSDSNVKPDIPIKNEDIIVVTEK